MKKKSFFLLDQVVRKTINTNPGWKVEQVLSFSDRKKFPVLMLCANLQAGKPNYKAKIIDRNPRR